MEISDGEPPVLVIGLNLFYTKFISYFPLLLHAWTDLKSIFLVFCVGKVFCLERKVHSYFKIVVVFGNWGR